MARNRGLLIALWLLGGCAFAPHDPIDTYDFGLMPPAAKGSAGLQVDLLVPDVVAPAWLDTPAILYRLAYRDAAHTRAYSQSRWVAAPAALLTERLRERLSAINRGGVITATDAAVADYLLRIELEEFSQVFDVPELSRVFVRVRGSLIRTQDQRVLAQRTFDAERPATSSDAVGAVRALAEASDEVIEAMLEWLALRLDSASHDAQRPGPPVGHAMNRFHHTVS